MIVPKPPMDLSDADPTSHYDIQERIGRGSFGEVFKGMNKHTKEVVAIKLIYLEAAEDEIEDIQQEILVLSQCNSAYITKYHGSFLKNTTLWIIMEYLGGGSALDLMKPGPIPEMHISVIMRDILKGLDYLHSQKKIHRDIKAANVLFSYHGDVKLADFGVAGQLNNTITKRVSFVGTPFWMAPELIQRCAYDFKVDIWSTGITAIELAKGEPPNAHLHPIRALLYIPHIPPPKLNDEYSKSFREFVDACLVKIPENRPTAHELLRYPFIRKVKKGKAILQELIERYRKWRETGGDDTGDDDDNEPSDEKADRNSDSRSGNHSKSSSETLKWVFDTVRESPAAAQASTNIPSSQPAEILPVTRSTSAVVNRGVINVSPTRKPLVQGDLRERRKGMENNHVPTSQPVSNEQMLRGASASSSSGPISLSTPAGHHQPPPPPRKMSEERVRPVSGILLQRTPYNPSQESHNQSSPERNQLQIDPNGTITQRNVSSHMNIRSEPHSTSRLAPLPQEPSTTSGNPKQQQQATDPSQSSCLSHHILPLLSDLRDVYDQIRSGGADAIDELVSAFQAVDATSPNYTTTFLTELVTRALDTNPRISDQTKRRTIARARMESSV